MVLFGLLGKSLSHSFSKKYFTEKFEKLGLSDHQYQLFEIPNIEQLPTLWSQNKLSGMNVTIPYKEQILPYLDGLDASAQKVGAVNVVKFLPNGQKIGYNSDFYGFKNSLLNEFKTQYFEIPSQALVLGTGGAAKAVIAALHDLDINVKTVSREANKADFTYTNLKNINLDAYKLIVNTSPLGMYPHIDQCPDIPYHKLSNQHFLFDLVYNPLDTLFMQKGREFGAKTANGLEMLHLQAEKAWEIWNS
jgi:shikimate dehydrogenase